MSFLHANFLQSYGITVKNYIVFMWIFKQVCKKYHRGDNIVGIEAMVPKSYPYRIQWVIKQRFSRPLSRKPNYLHRMGYSCSNLKITDIAGPCLDFKSNREYNGDEWEAIPAQHFF
jgi:hypothetical protein